MHHCISMGIKAMILTFTNATTWFGYSWIKQWVYLKLKMNLIDTKELKLNKRNEYLFFSGLFVETAEVFSIKRNN